jgi:membrane associated rhomboid family serine protease
MTALMAFCGVIGGYLDNPALEFWGGLRRAEVENSAWWRLVSYGFSSPGPVIGLVNVAMILILGRRVEKVLGSQNTLGLLVVALLFGGIFSLYVHPTYWIAGSSTMVLAYCVGFLTTIAFHKMPFPTGMFVACLGYLLFAFTLGFLDYMDHAANLGGIVSALLILFLSQKSLSNR